MPTSPRSLFLNLAVKDLAAAKAFFARLGFTFNAQFTSDDAACMVISDLAYVMLLRQPMFQSFTAKAVCDTATHSEGLVAVSCQSRAEVDELFAAAIAAGGSAAMPPQDHGFMYMKTFYDLDGHHWEVLWMDPAHVQPT
jgi:uncharacterized protein